MDDATVAVCKHCKAWIFYDEDAEEPELCTECEEKSKKRREAEDKLIEEHGG